MKIKQNNRVPTTFNRILSDFDPVLVGNNNIRNTGGIPGEGGRAQLNCLSTLKLGLGDEGASPCGKKKVAFSINIF